jgi:dTDP-4-dehydrorhamnose 3,5-epimerase
MIFQETELAGVFEIGLEPKCDERGFFARSWCQQEFEQQGLSQRPVQCSISFNRKKGTLRGMHYQIEDYAETKLVRCTRGAIYDVAVDLRPHSATFMRWMGVELTSTNRHALYIPEGCAHGFLTLADDTEVLYQISETYHPEAARGVRWNDPAFNIAWPELVEVISERDRTYSDFESR